MIKPIDILVTLDENYLAPLKVMLLSLHRNNSKERFKIWLVHNSIPTEKLLDLENLVINLGSILKPLVIDNSLLKDIPTTARYPKTMYFRLFCGKILPEEIEKVIYLDPDVLIINSIRKLRDLNLEGKTIAAAVHSGFISITRPINNARLGIKKGYFNSGVMLIDVKKIRKEIKLEDIYSIIQKRKGMLIFPDQDVLNCLYNEKIKEIPEEIWNFDSRDSLTYFAKSLGKINTEWIMKNTVILHFCGKIKPWNSHRNNPFFLLYQHYQNCLKRDYLN